MDEKESQRVKERYAAIKAQCEGWPELAASLRDDPDETALRVEFCDDLLYSICAHLVRWPEKERAEVTELKRLFAQNVRRLPAAAEVYPYFSAVACFFEGDRARCLSLLKRELEWRWADAADPMKETHLTDFYVDAFKEAFPGFWAELASLLRRVPCEPGVRELCALLERYYLCEDAAAEAELLLPFAAAWPALSLPKELLGLAWYEQKRWHEARACFAQVRGRNVLLYSGDILFYMAWCSGQLRQYGREEACYRQSLEEQPELGWALNNLGYCLYRQKRYEEALEIFRRCLDEERDLPYAADNAVRTLLALGRYREARELIGNSPCTIAADLRRRAEQAPAEDRPVKGSIPVPPEDGEEQAAPPLPGTRQQQFSTEDALERELLAHLERGEGLFGLPLRVYERETDYYGRQYRIDGGKGRLDLLCEDAEGNLYVVELKRDGGYRNPYEQIRYYLDWVQEHLTPKGRHTYGIICGHDPDPTLRERVRRDPQVRLFAYSLRYHELT